MYLPIYMNVFYPIESSWDNIRVSNTNKRENNNCFLQTFLVGYLTNLATNFHLGLESSRVYLSACVLFRYNSKVNHCGAQGF